MDDSQRRKAANEAVFRQVNEQIEHLQMRYALSEQEPLSLVCECDRLYCAQPLSVDVETYERTREHADRFLVAPGHEDPAVEDILDTGSGFLIVRKHAGEPRDIAAQTDPRS
jgi:hypothetical protein